MAKRRYRKTLTCTVCESLFDTSRYSVAQTCSPRCRGVLQRRTSELKLRLHCWFGQLTDREIAKKAGKAVSTVALARKKLGIAPVAPITKIAQRPWHSLAGTMPDSHVAKKFGISPVTVLPYRQKKSIPVFVPPVPSWHGLVGTMSDSALARQLGIDRSTISNHRQRYGLPAARSL